MIDTCHYCGATYHPMSVYTLARENITMSKWPRGDDGIGLPYRIHVCRLKFEISDEGDVEIEIHDDCHDQAVADGYEYREDLTPKR